MIEQCAAEAVTLRRVDQIDRVDLAADLAGLATRTGIAEPDDLARRVAADEVDARRALQMRPALL